MSQVSVAKLYQSVIDEVIESVRDAVQDEGLDDQVLIELKQLWEQKLKTSKALEGKKQPDKPIPAASATISAQPMVNSQQVYRQQPVRQFAQTVPLSMSGAAALATNAVTTRYPQHLLPAGRLQGVSHQGNVTIIPTAIQPANITLQQQSHAIHQLQAHPQNLSTKVQGQLDGANDNDDVTAMPSHLDSISNEDLSPSPRTAAETDTQAPAHLSPACGAAPSNDPSISSDLSCRPKTTPRRRRNRKARDIEIVVQLDGGGDTSSDEDDDIDDDDEDDVDNEGEDGEGEEEPLNSADDDDDDPEEVGNMVDTENVIVCQYDKVTRSKNRWRFTLKDGIMNIDSRDYVFQKANGEAEW